MLCSLRDGRARTCDDHTAGEMAVSLHDRLVARKWFSRNRPQNANYFVTALGLREMTSLGIDVRPLQSARRRIACACLDWSERRPHLGGAVGAALLAHALQRKWVQKDLDS